MPDERIILCLNCGQQNRLKANGRPDLARCGRCGEPLAPPRKRIRAQGWVGVLLAAAVGVLGYVAYVNQPYSSRVTGLLKEALEHLAAEGVGVSAPPPGVNPFREALTSPVKPIPRPLSLSAAESRPPTAEPSSGSSPPPSPAGDHRAPRPMSRPPQGDDLSDVLKADATAGTRRHEERPLSAPRVAISTGIVRTRPGRERIAPLEIRTSSGNDYFLRLLDVIDGQEELALYIEGARTFNTDVSLGSYELRYCAGEIWYGEPYRFGPDTVCYRADKQFTFYRRGNSVNGYTIELILQVGGNLRTTRIDPTQF